MSDIEIDTVVTLRGYTTPMESEEALDVLDHLADYDPPAEYSNQMTSVEGTDPELAEAAQVVWGDHVPENFDVTDPETRPHLFYATYDDRGEGRVLVSLKTTQEAFPDFDEALEHVFERVELEPAMLDAAVSTDLDLTFDDVEAPELFMLQNAHAPVRESAFVISPIDQAFDAGDDASFGDAVDAMTDAMGELEDGETELSGQTTTFSLSGVLDPGIEDLREQFEEYWESEQEAERLKEKLAAADDVTAETDHVQTVAVTFEGETRPLDEAEATEILGDVSDHDPASEYTVYADPDPDEDSSLLDSVPLVGGEEVEEGGVMWADHKPAEETDEMEPTVFVADYDGERVQVFVRTTADTVGDFDGALERLYQHESLDVERLAAAIESDKDVDIGHVELPDDGYSMFSGAGLQLKAMQGVLKDKTTTFTLADTLESELEGMADDVESRVGPVESATFVAQTMTEQRDAEAAAEILQHVAAFEPSADDIEPIATADAIDADTAEDVSLAWSDHLPEQFADGEEPDVDYASYDATPQFFYAGYDDSFQQRVKLVAVVEVDDLSAADEFYDHVFEVTDVEPGKMDATFEPEGGHDLDQFPSPAGFRTLLYDGTISFSADEDIFIDDTSVTFLPGEQFQPPLVDVVAEVETAPEDTDDDFGVW